MIKVDRHIFILNELNKKNLVRVSSLAKSMNVAEMTIRRDLKELEEIGHLMRVHGGAKIKPKSFYQEDNYNKKILVKVCEKREICKKAATKIKENETIFIGSGSTTVHLYEFIKDMNINIVTNSITIFEQFKESKNCNLIFVGGRYRPKIKGFVGYFTQETLSKISVNKAFIGVNGVGLDNITISDEEEGKCNEIILNNATEKYVLADSSKFFTYAFYSFYKPYNLTAIITDSNLDCNLRDQYKKIIDII